MSVLIKGMKMPRNCEYCRFSGIGGLRNERVVCMFTGANAYMNTVQYLDDCPLVEVPPHGRLLDADDVFNVLTSYYHHSTDFQHEALKEALARVSTIIGAEDGE